MYMYTLDTKHLKWNVQNKNYSIALKSVLFNVNTGFVTIWWFEIQQRSDLSQRNLNVHDGGVFFAHRAWSALFFALFTCMEDEKWKYKQSKLLFQFSNTGIVFLYIFFNCRKSMYGQKPCKQKGIWFFSLHTWNLIELNL